jgi:hypothetical protein
MVIVKAKESTGREGRVMFRVCYLRLAVVTSGIVMGALFVFSGSAHDVSVPSAVYYTKTVDYTGFVVGPADVDRNEEVFPSCTVYVATRMWSAG